MYNGPGIYEHYKGNKYRIEGLAWDKNGEHRLVVYRPVSLESNDEDPSILFWVRSLENFNQEVDGKQRFDFCEYLS